MVRFAVMASLLISTGALAGGFTVETNIVVKEGSSLEITSKPGLQSKKLNILKIMPSGKEPVKVLKFDAQMPEHEHGMVVEATQPKKLDDGSYEVRGVKLHMPGQWVLEVTVELDGKPKVFKKSYLVEP